MEIELEPDQPAEVTKAIADAVRGTPREPDPWWRAGIDEQLEP